MSGVTIHLNQFEGPMGLLLYLIRKEEMDIMNINIFQITGQYLAYIKNMNTLDLENAGDFISMAATLIHIKSRMLLPDHKLSDEDDLPEDPRKELVQKLLDYQRYKEASINLYSRTLLNRDVWLKGAKEPMPEGVDDSIWVEDNALFGLISTYRRTVKRAKTAVHRVSQRMQSVASRILEIKKYLIPGTWVSFFEILKNEKVKPEQNKSRLLITFLSLLELGKLGLVRVFQTDNYGDIHVEALTDIDGDVISQVEEYEILDAEERVTELFKEETVSLNFEDDEPEESALAASPQLSLSERKKDDDQALVSASVHETAEALVDEIRKDLESSLPSEEIQSLNFLELATDTEIEDEEKLLGLNSEEEEVDSLV